MWLGAPQAKVRTISGEGGIKVSETVLSHGTLQDWSPPPPPHHHQHHSASGVQPLPQYLEVLSILR